MGAVRRRHPDAPTPWIDLSTGINPRPYPVGTVPREAWSRLPSHEAEQALLEAAATRYGGDAGAIVAAPGTQALIQILPRLVGRSKVAIVGPTYGEHELCWRSHDHEVAVVPTLADAAGADVVVVVNPDNPTGRLIAPRDLHAVKARLLVVDEAFIDFDPADASLAGHLPENAVVLRSFGKTYGLAGLRLGFALAPPPLVARLRDTLGPWAVSGPALEIGRRALADQAWLQATADRLRVDGRKTDALLVAAGFTLAGGTSLFRLVRHEQAPLMVERLARRGIHVRAFADRPTSLRFGLPAGEADFGRLAIALQVPQKV
ncbi:threonine-phosphate decarboxylase CobD [soil metagenome]